MADYVKKTKAFHDKFNLPTSMIPTLVEPTVAMHKVRLLLEELSELAKAIEQQSLLRVADSVTDLLSVAFSTAVTYGLPIDELFEIVHKANMQRDIGFDSNGKIPKGPNYTHPDQQIAALLQLSL